jgi:hypothetical protein
VFGRRCRHIVIVDRVTAPALSAITVASVSTDAGSGRSVLPRSIRSATRVARTPEAGRRLRQSPTSGDPGIAGGFLGPLASLADVEPVQPLAGAISTAIGETP